MNAYRRLSRAKWLIGCAVASLAIGAHAQSGGESADALLRDADAVFKQLDAGQYGAVWTNAVAFVKTRIKQDQFAADMQQARRSVGTVSHRGWAQITRIWPSRPVFPRPVSAVAQGKWCRQFAVAT
ncbi:DUF4019 domain-containing protein [Burkholderia ambifaria]